MYKVDLALNNLQWLVCHKTKPNQAEILLFSHPVHEAMLGIYMCVCMVVYDYICFQYIYMCVCVWLCMIIYVFIYIYIYVCVCVCFCVQKNCCESKERTGIFYYR